MTPQDHADSLYGLAYLAESESKPEQAKALRDAAKELLELNRQLCTAMALLEIEIITCETLLNEEDSRCLN